MRHLLLILSLLCLTHAETYDVEVSASPIRSVDERFLSFTLDTLSLYPDTWNYLNFSFITPLARALSPAYFRVGGTYSDLFYFNETNMGSDSMSNQEIPGCLFNSIFHSNTCSIFTAKQFEDLYNFGSSSGLRMVFCLNIMLRQGKVTQETIHQSRLNVTNIKKILDFASSKGWTELDWELGNEPDGFKGLFWNYTLTGANLAQDFEDMMALKNSYDLYKNSVLMGPSASGMGGNNWVIGDFVAAGGSKYINAMTVHHYHENGPNAHLGDFTNSSWMDQYMWDCVTLLKNKSKGFSPLWNGETSTMSGGGAVNMSSRYVSGFLWLDKLGLSATYGIDVVMRQALIGGGGPYPFGNYTMLDKYGLPLPDYWLSFVYKKLVGQQSFNVTFTPFNKNLRLYSGSNRNSEGFVLYGEWLENDSVTIDLPSLSNRQVSVFLLKEGTPGDLRSDKSRLNGELIDWNTHVPLANLKGNLTNLPITLPGLSQFFIVTRPIASKSCPNGWNQSLTTSNKCYKTVKNSQPWFSSQFDCQTYGANSSLVSIGSAFENAEVSKLSSGCSQLYLGLYKNGANWEWSNGENTSYRNWKSGYPLNDNTQNCVSLDSKTSTWMNSDCDSLQCYICQIYV